MSGTTTERKLKDCVIFCISAHIKSMNYLHQFSNTYQFSHKLQSICFLNVFIEFRSS